MQKEINVQVNRNHGTAGLLQGLPHNAIWNCNVLTTFLWIGILTAPPRYRGFDLSTFWAWLRYASAISERDSGLRLKPIWSEIDAHQKTVMSDDFGMGFACHYLAEQHGIQAFANTAYLLDSLVGVTTLRPGKRGPAKSPDFIAIDSQGRLHILECKGTQSSTEYLRTALAAGIAQKNNFTNATPFASCMVGGIFVPQHSSPEDAVLLYIDPRPDGRLLELAKMPLPKIEQGIYRISLAKELMAAGMWRTASDVERRGGPSGDGGSDLTSIEADLASAGFSRDDHAWRRTMQYRSIEIDNMGSASQYEQVEHSRKTILQTEISDDVTGFVREVLLMDHGGAQDEANRLIVTRAKDRTQRRSTSIRSQIDEAGPFRLRTRKVASAWEEQSPSSTSAALTGPSGIRFVLSREEG